MRVRAVADPVLEEAEGPDVDVAVGDRPQEAEQTRSGGDLKTKTFSLENFLRKLNSFFLFSEPF